MSLHWGIDDKQGISFVTGEPQMSDVAKDAVDQVSKDLHWMTEDGTQSGSHPAKSQPKTPKYFE